MFAAHHKLNNLIQVIDRNYIQIDGPTEKVLSLDSLKQKYKAFHWHTIEIDGNNIKSFVKAVEEAKKITDRPSVIIAKTVPGKGVSFMEGDFIWHGKAPTQEIADKALLELKKKQDNLEAKLTYVKS